MRRVRLLTLVWPLWGKGDKRARPPKRAVSAARPRVALAIQAAHAAQATAALPAYWAVYGWGGEQTRPARNPFDTRRTQAWQAIDQTLTELRAS